MTSPSEPPLEGEYVATALWPDGEPQDTGLHLELHCMVKDNEIVSCWLSARRYNGAPVVLARSQGERAMRRPVVEGEE